MQHLITGVEVGSVAERHGLRVGDAIETINGEPLIDEIDYQALCAGDALTLGLVRDGRPQTLTVRKEDWEPLGLHFGDTMTLSPRPCHNNCVFCFIDQMPPDMRETLYVKDDDWRYSLMMGNFVTLTNVSDAEFERIIRRHATPLFVSVHTTNPELRCRMMNNRFAGDVLDKLRRLAAARIRFHCQIVCCPTYNDGAELMRTLRDLRGILDPDGDCATLSVAVVPVGLTKFRDGLAKLPQFHRDSAKALLDMLAPFQAECRETLGTSFVFPSDEFYCLSGEPLPSESWYEGYPQIENGVGLLRQFESDAELAQEDDEEAAQWTAEADSAPEAHDASVGEASQKNDGNAASAAPAITESGIANAASTPRTIVLVSGVSAANHMRHMAERFAPQNTTVRVAVIRNRFFGETITVTGLLTGGDTLEQLTPELLDGADLVCISRNMLRHERDLFLDDMSLDEFTRRLGKPVRIIDDGEDFYAALHGRSNDDPNATLPDTAGFYVTVR